VRDKATQRYNKRNNRERIEALPEIIDGCRRSPPVLIDGGFRRGTDIVNTPMGARRCASATLARRVRSYCPVLLHPHSQPRESSRDYRITTDSLDSTFFRQALRVHARVLASGSSVMIRCGKAPLTARRLAEVRSIDPYDKPLCVAYDGTLILTDFVV